MAALKAQWDLRLKAGGVWRWVPIWEEANAIMEDAFQNAAIRTIVIEPVLYDIRCFPSLPKVGCPASPPRFPSNRARRPHPTLSPSQRTFEVDGMLIVFEDRRSFPLRRRLVCNDYSTPLTDWGTIGVTGVQFWNGAQWQSFTMQDRVHIHCLLRVGRKTTVVYNTPDDNDRECGSYIIDLDPDCPTQTNRATATTRPLRLSYAKDRFGHFAMPSDAEEEFVIEDDDRMPNEFKCPITSLPMVIPVVLNDGFTYEKAAIERWLQRKKVSPVTGDRIDDVCMIHNVNLRKLIRDYVASTPSTSTGDAPETGKKRGSVSSCKRHKGVQANEEIPSDEDD